MLYNTHYHQQQGEGIKTTIGAYKHITILIHLITYFSLIT